jgi:hypothetical protein
MRRNPDYAGEIRKIADVVYEQYRLFKDLTSDPCAGCLDFRLPAAADLAAARPAFVNR